jgi:hypothetical protein
VISKCMGLILVLIELQMPHLQCKPVDVAPMLAGGKSAASAASQLSAFAFSGGGESLAYGESCLHTALDAHTHVLVAYLGALASRCGILTVALLC